MNIGMQIRINMQYHLRYIEDHFYCLIEEHRNDPQDLYSLVCMIKSMLLVYYYSCPFLQGSKLPHLNLNINQEKLNNLKHLVSQHQPHFKCSVSTCVQSPQIQKIFIIPGSYCRVLLQHITYLTQSVIFGRVVVT